MGAFVLPWKEFAVGSLGVGVERIVSFLLLIQQVRTARIQTVSVQKFPVLLKDSTAAEAKLCFGFLPSSWLLTIKKMKRSLN